MIHGTVKEQMAYDRWVEKTFGGVVVYYEVGTKKIRGLDEALKVRDSQHRGEAEVFRVSEEVWP